MTLSPNASPARPIKRALVLSGGGGRGAFQCGVIEELDAQGWRPDMLVGTSIGSHNAALWAAGGVARVVAFWDRVRTHHMQRFFRLRGWEGLMDRRPWAATLRNILPEHELAQIRTPLYLVASNLTTGRPVIFTNDRDLDSDKPHYQKVTLGHQHLLASSAIPLFYPPITIGSEKYWDGAVMYNSPLSPAIDAGASEVIAVLLSPFRGMSGAPPSALPAPRSGFAGLVGLALDLAITATFENDYSNLQRINEDVRKEIDQASHREVLCEVVAPPSWLSPLEIGRYQPAQIGRLRAEGRAQARAAMAQLTAGRQRSASLPAG